MVGRDKNADNVGNRGKRRETLKSELDEDHEKCEALYERLVSVPTATDVVYSRRIELSKGGVYATRSAF